MAFHAAGALWGSAEAHVRAIHALAQVLTPRSQPVFNSNTNRRPNADTDSNGRLFFLHVSNVSMWEIGHHIATYRSPGREFLCKMKRPKKRRPALFKREEGHPTFYYETQKENS